ncbi:unannotated protein [freshwater metagenome]|uniref:Unannotated protein n=1 Tax=freshwater metagenome TaxID=449393 RepID=A0A6J7I421_9ZZZZ
MLVCGHERLAEVNGGFMRFSRVWAVLAGPIATFAALAVGVTGSPQNASAALAGSAVADTSSSRGEFSAGMQGVHGGP